MWVVGYVPHSQFHEHVLEILSNAHLSDHVWVNKRHRLNGDFQPCVVEHAVVVLPSISDLSVYAFRAFDRSVRVIETCEERDGTSSFSIGQGSRSRTGGGGTELLASLSNLLFVLLSFDCNQHPRKKTQI
ncbi:hypothetical protein F2Q70_00043319 [Brassica cretica]|uniref:Uncharacterized protein n=1 Tax=Brassica cretica TaxID=69181 RepID=A0A8S9KHP8_BRACR|nr:hypothetical protein F2Q70_00043319 [Brassica cretica]